ncbi:hypothetical protein [Mycobacterium paraterrae]|uniref:PE-PPE domain-containing protein n=1 Tax=Mycobacterium paraterrae TaxID=577492 RepID=A0ABY3VS85_9MYCO|nr:hypothetical protein [Mycobacterium paraterrae]UMB70956.1 hypothetical protein MKK62_06640 [Mycobacterium paraterrae]
MLAASRSYLLAAAALTATGAAIAAPLVMHMHQGATLSQAALPVRSIETKLVDAGDVANIPTNLFNDILSIPYNELEGGGLASVANSFLFTGTWWVPSSTNLWGIDPGDPTHIALIDNFIPFSAFTEGFTNSDGVYEPGLNYEFAGLLAAELPVSSSCDAMSCAPMTPPDVITGNTGYDRDLGFLAALMGKATDANGDPNGLFTNFFQVPLQNLFNGYLFQAPPDDIPPTTGEPTYDTGIINPGGPVNDEWAQLLGWGASGDPFEGGTHVVDGQDVMPWDGVNYQLNLLQPFQTLYDSLTQDPASNPVEIPSFDGIMHTFENLAAGSIIDFDPFTAGSPACPAQCDIPDAYQIPSLVKAISDADPSNEVLKTWVTDYAINPQLVNEPTQDQINASIALLQTGSYNFTPEQLEEVIGALDRINPELPELYVNSGIITDPNYLTYALDPSDTSVLEDGKLVGEFGGYNPWLEGTDFLKVLEAAGSNPVDPTLSQDLNILFTNFTFPGDPGALASVFGEGAASTSASAIDPSSYALDLSSLLGGLGSTAGADALSSILAELSAQFSADLAQLVPQAVLSAF